jgi:hypothetical protein
MAKKTEVKPEKTEKAKPAAPAPRATSAPPAKPAPPAKTAAGSKSPAGRTPRADTEADPALASFSEGLAALDRKEWSRAVELFGQAMAASDRSDLTARARQYKAVAEQRLATAAAAAPDEADPYLQAIFEKNRGNYKAALDISTKGGRDKKDERFAYLVAAIHALENRPEEAAAALALAVELNAKNRIHAFHDADFAELKKNRDHRHLFGLS